MSETTPPLQAGGERCGRDAGWDGSEAGGEGGTEEPECAVHAARLAGQKCHSKAGIEIETLRHQFVFSRRLSRYAIHGILDHISRPACHACTRKSEIVQTMED